MFIQQNDPRVFTNWNPSSDIDEEIKQKNKITDTYSYRLYLQRNAEKLMKEERDKIEINKVLCDCPKCIAAAKK